jgi:N-acetylneuraminic acid mutarotase
MPTERDALYTCVVNGKIYAIGGRKGDEQGGNGIVIKTVEEYDPVKDNWIKKADMPTARCFLSTSVVEEKIYAIGGFSLYVGNALSTVEVYDPMTDRWAKCSDMPTKRGILSTSVVNGKIYAIGGNEIPHGVSLSAVEEYDPIKDTWAKKADMPTARCSLTTCVVNDEIYAMGGMPENEVWAVCKPLSTVESYNPATDTWTKKANMPTERIGHHASVINGKIYVIGGSDHNVYTSKAVEVYDLITDTWTKGTDMPIACTCLSTSVVGGKIYAIGGYGDQNLLSTVQEYTPEDWSFNVSPNGKLPTTWGQRKLEKLDR